MNTLDESLGRKFVAPSRDHAIIAEIYGPGVHLAVADATGLRLETVRDISAAQHPTFTGALQSFANAVGLELQDCPLAICAAGAIGNDTIRITNGRWFISRSGLTALTRTDVLVLNDVGAMAWAAAGITPSSCRTISAARIPGDSRPQVVLWIGDGVGAAVIVRVDGRVTHVVETEAGHCTFAAETPEEWALVERLRRVHGHCSAERVMLAERPAARGDALAGADAADHALAALASLSGDLVLSYAAWDGLFLAGPDAAHLFESDRAHRFMARFVAKGRMRKLLEATPVWLLTERHLALRGAYAALRAHQSTGR